MLFKIGFNDEIFEGEVVETKGEYKKLKIMTNDGDWRFAWFCDKEIKILHDDSVETKTYLKG